MAQGLFALAGVVVGFLLKAIFDYITENRRWAREDRLYFKDKRLEAYASLVSLAELMSMTSWELQVKGKEDEYVDLMHRFLTAYQTAYMLASSTTRNQANGVLEAVQQCSPMSGKKPTNEEELMQNHMLLYQRTTLFQNQVQKELNIF